ncbi:MAG: SLC13/DASS family transporter [Bacteroidaceae bacterium]|nr:SLC13/DASS family transporter [Bacteroidaceae bacterium]
MNANLVKTVKLVAVVLISLILWWLPSTAFGIPDLTILQQRMIAIFVFAALMWILEVVPAWVTSVLIFVIMLFTVSDSSLACLINPANFPDAQRLADPETGALGGVAGLISYKAIMASFADPTVILFLGGFTLASVAAKSGVDVSLARIMLKPFGTNSNIVLLGFIFVTAIFSMFVSNTATAAMMLTFLAPVLKSLPSSEKGKLALALAIPIGANIGGIATPIGTPPNGIALGYINKAVSEGGLGYNIGFLDWMIVMFPLMVIILLIAWVLLRSIYGFTSKTIELKIEGGAENGWKTKVIYLVLIVTILLWCFGKNLGLNVYVVAMFPFAAFAALGMLDHKDLQGLDWAVLWMVAGGFALGLGMDKTGLADALVEAIPFHTWPVILVLVGGGLICWILSTFISNSAAAALMVPILVAVGKGMESQLAGLGGLITLIVGVALSASFAMALPISTPPNAIAYSTGLIKSSQMAKVGVIIGVIAMAVGYLALVLVGQMGVFGTPQVG